MSGLEDGSWTGSGLPSRRNTSRAEGRSSGRRRSRSTHRALRSSGTPGASSHGAGGSNRCLSISTARVPPRNGNRPVRASKSITPTLYQSLAGETGKPAACSGAM